MGILNKLFIRSKQKVTKKDLSGSDYHFFDELGNLCLVKHTNKVDYSKNEGSHEYNMVRFPINDENVSKTKKMFGGISKHDMFYDPSEWDEIKHIKKVKKKTNEPKKDYCDVDKFHYYGNRSEDMSLTKGQRAKAKCEYNKLCNSPYVDAYMSRKFGKNWNK